MGKEKEEEEEKTKIGPRDAVMGTEANGFL